MSNKVFDNETYEHQRINIELLAKNIQTIGSIKAKWHSKQEEGHGLRQSIEYAHVVAEILQKAIKQ